MRRITFFRYKNSGFTLIELGIVLAVLSLMLGGVLAVATQNVRVAKKEELKIKMDAIESALLAFRKVNGYIPCPGDLTQQTDDADFGVRAPDAGVCNGSSPAAFVNTAVTAAAGMVPVRDLGLPDSYAIDPWGGYFVYVTDLGATSTTTFTPNKITDTSTLGVITVLDELGGTRTAVAIAVLISFGPNGHGAYQVGGVRKLVSSTNDHEGQNCYCTPYPGGVFDIATFYQHPATTSPNDALDSFDDIVRYYTRGQFLSATSDAITDKP